MGRLGSCGFGPRLQERMEESHRTGRVPSSLELLNMGAGTRFRLYILQQVRIRWGSSFIAMLSGYVDDTLRTLFYMLGQLDAPQILQKTAVERIDSKS
jgi:hypothetical protein